MRRRRTAEEVARLLREADRDLAKGLTVSDICRKVGIAETTYYRWRQRHDPDQVDARSPVSRAGTRGRASQEAGGRVAPGQADAPGHRKKKVVSPDQQRAAADYLSERYKVSQRRISRVMGRSRSVLRYRRSRRPDEQPLTREIKRLARRHPRYGYRRIHALLVRGGWSVNLKRVRRLWNEPGTATALEAEKTQEIGPETWDQRQQLRPATGPVQERRLDL